MAVCAGEHDAGEHNDGELQQRSRKYTIHSCGGVVAEELARSSIVIFDGCLFAKASSRFGSDVIALGFLSLVTLCGRGA